MGVLARRAPSRDSNERGSQQYQVLIGKTIDFAGREAKLINSKKKRKK